MHLVWGSVKEILKDTTELQEMTVAIHGYEGRQVACSYPALIGKCEIGEQVLLNTTAVDLSLGTGGRHFVVAREGAEYEAPAPQGGHIMKLRYTPLQRDVLSVEDPKSDYHDVMVSARSLEGMPVVCCSLHSQMPLVAAAAKAINKNLKIVYVMTDEAALSYGFSRVAMQSREAGLVDASVSCGQAFGAEYEAVSLHSALLFAHTVLNAGVAIVAIGPGTVGTETKFGNTGIAQGEALNAVCAIKGTPITALRVSYGDLRERHRGVSHHSLTSLCDIALSRVCIPIPENMCEEIKQDIVSTLKERSLDTKHNIEYVTVPKDIDLCGIRVTTMGRDYSQDSFFFELSYAAGVYAAQCAQSAK
jgi:hypothetical protein